MKARSAVFPVLLALFLVCGQSKFCGAVEAEAAAKPAARPAGVPAKASIWMILPTPKGTMDRLKKLVDQFQPGAGGMAELFIRQSCPWDFPETDEAKPLIVLCDLPENEGQKPTWAAAGALKAGANAGAALEKRFGAKPDRVAEGISVFTQVQEGDLPDKEVYATVKDGRLVLGDSQKLVKLLAAEPAPAADAYAPGADLIAGADVGQLAAQHKAQIEDALTELEDFFETMANLGNIDDDDADDGDDADDNADDDDAVDGDDADDEEDDGADDPAAAIEAAAEEGRKQREQRFITNFGKALVKTCRQGLKQVDQIGLQVRMGESVCTAITVKARPGTTLAAEFERFEKCKLPSPSLLQEKNIFATVGSVPPEYLARCAGFLGTIIEFAAASDEDADKAKAAEEDIKKLVQNLGIIGQQLDGTFGCSMGTLDAPGMALHAGIRDPVATRNATNAFTKIMVSGPLAELLDKGDATRITFKENIRKLGELPVDRTVTKFTGEDPDLPADMAAAQVKAAELVYGEMPVNSDSVYTKDSMLTAAGKNCVTMLEDMFSRSTGAKPGTQAMAGTIKSAPKGTFLAGEFRTLEAMAVLVKTAEDEEGNLAIFKINMPKETDKAPTTFYMASSGGEMTAELRVPVAPISKLVEAFRAEK